MSMANCLAFFKFRNTSRMSGSLMLFGFPFSSFIVTAPRQNDRASSVRRTSFRVDAKTGIDIQNAIPETRTANDTAELRRAINKSRPRRRAVGSVSNDDDPRRTRCFGEGIRCRGL